MPMAHATASKLSSFYNLLIFSVMSTDPYAHMRYASPTRSSLMRAKPAANLRERVKNINERIDDLTYDHFSNTE